MEIQNTINLLNDSNKEEPKFATKKKKKKKRYVIDSQTAKNKYNQNNYL